MSWSGRAKKQTKHRLRRIFPRFVIWGKSFFRFQKSGLSPLSFPHFHAQSTKYTHKHKTHTSEGEEAEMKAGGGVAHCSSTDSSEQTICLNWQHPVLLGDITAGLQKHLLKWGFFSFFFFPLWANWKSRERNGPKKENWHSHETWMDSAHLIKIKRFNSREIGAAIRCARHVGGGGPFWLVASRRVPRHFDARQSFAFSINTLQQPSNYQNQAHLHDWNIIMVCQKHSSLLVPFLQFVFFPVFSSLRWRAPERKYIEIRFFTARKIMC